MKHRTRTSAMLTLTNSTRFSLFSISLLVILLFIAIHILVVVVSLFLRSLFVFQRDSQNEYIYFITNYSAAAEINMFAGRMTEALFPWHEFIDGSSQHDKNMINAKCEHPRSEHVYCCLSLCSHLRRTSSSTSRGPCRAENGGMVWLI